MCVSFNIITNKKQIIWLNRKKIMKYFNLTYCRKGRGISTLIDDNDNYIIKISKRGFHFLISDNDEESIDKFIDEFIGFINLNFKNTTLGFRQEVGKKILLDKFKNIEIIDIS